MALFTNKRSWKGETPQVWACARVHRTIFFDSSLCLSNLLSHWEYWLQKDGAISHISGKFFVSCCFLVVDRKTNRQTNEKNTQKHSQRWTSQIIIIGSEFYEWIMCCEYLFGDRINQNFAVRMGWLCDGRTTRDVNTLRLTITSLIVSSKPREWYFSIIFFFQMREVIFLFLHLLSTPMLTHIWIVVLTISARALKCKETKIVHKRAEENKLAIL